MENELKVLYIGRVIRVLGSCQPIEEGLIILLLRLTRILPFGSFSDSLDRDVCFGIDD